jgi:hypothetical protein
VGNDVDNLHEERKHIVGFSFIRVYRSVSPDLLTLNLVPNLHCF